MLECIPPNLVLQITLIITSASSTEVLEKALSFIFFHLPRGITNATSDVTRIDAVNRTVRIAVSGS